METVGIFNRLYFISNYKIGQFFISLLEFNLLTVEYFDFVVVAQFEYVILF